MTGSCTTNVSMTVDTTHVLPGMKNTIRKMSPSSSDDDEPRLTNKSLFSGEKKRLYEQQDGDAAAPFSKITSSTFFGVGERRSCPSEKSFMLSSSPSKLPFSNDRTTSTRQHSTSSAADVAVQKIGCLMNTWKHEREGGYHKTQERYSEPSISCSSNTGGGTEASSFSKLSALRAARHERASSHGSTDSDESRTRVLNVLGRASEIIKSIDTATKSNTTETDYEDVRPRQGVRQRRLAVFNLCDTIMMEDEDEKKEDEPVNDDEAGRVCSTDEKEPQLSLKTNCGFRLSEPRIMNKQRRATGGSTYTTARDVIDLLERHHAAAAAAEQNDFLALETRQLSSSSSASSCGSTSSNTSLREPDEMVASISSSTTMSY